MVASSVNGIPLSSAYAFISSRETKSNGRIYFPVRADIPFRPLIPVPRRMRINTVSVWSSAWCASATKSHSPDASRLSNTP